jgi:hypothetical protein
MSNTQTQEVNDLLMGGGGPPAFKFEKVGDTAKGVITSIGKTQATDLKTRELKFYPDGNPIMQVVITLRQENNDETRVFCKPAAKTAVRDAVQAAEASGLEVGGKLAIQYSGDEPTGPGLSPKKLFNAQYVAPTNSISAEDLI